MKKKIVSYIFLLSYVVCIIAKNLPDAPYDVTVVGYLRFSNGLGRNAIAALDYLHDSLRMNYKKTRIHSFSLNDCPAKVVQLLHTSNNRARSNVAILYDTLDTLKKNEMPPSYIQLSYTMLEATAIFPEWIKTINTQFDAIVVPDIFLKDVYKNSGVRKPIFVLPHPVYMDEFLAKPIKTKPNKPFAFAMSCVLSDHKNYKRIVDAFLAEFRNSNDVVLRIQCPIENEHTTQLKQKLLSEGIKNIFLNTTELPWKDYVEFMSSIDVYCLVSKAEGFSVTPREALAMGIPCVLSNNTAHKTICNTGLVYPVESNILEPHINNRRICGYNFNCKLEDVQKALREVYTNYNYYLRKARPGREWVKQYHGNNLKKKYLSLFKPKQVILGDENKVTEDYLMTTDPNLYGKYVSLAAK